MLSLPLSPIGVLLALLVTNDTLDMIAGMMPIALALGGAGELRAPMARAVTGGLITSTLLMRWVVPVACTYFDDFGAWVARRLGARNEMEVYPAPAASAPAAYARAFRAALGVPSR